MIKKKKQPWPTKEVMEQVYSMKLWGDNNSGFYSGEGSHKPEIINPYLKVVIEFLSTFKKPIKICDLGCGDFNVGKELVKYSKKYFAIDIVKDLIDYNKNNFKANNLEFYCLDITKDNLPYADCAIVRQVLQHLSNKDVQSVLSNLKNFKYVIITEHIPNGSFIPNKDIISGQGIRLKKQSGLEILKAPFNFKIKEEKQLLSINLNQNKGVLVTNLYTVL